MITTPQGRPNGRCAGFHVIAIGNRLYERGLTRFAARADKQWSLTDRISFVVMEDEGLTDALAGDRHFEQAGFKALLGE
jgi:predicted nucleic acid-binding protein